MDDSFCLDLDALAGFERPVLCFTPAGVCSYANAAAQKLCGRRPLVGVTVQELFPDDEERRHVLDQLGRRIRGEASTYETTFTQPLERVRIPVHVYAFPVVGHGGAAEGSLAIVTDLRQRRVRQAMHKAIETLREGDEILTAVADELQALVPFDDFRVMARSADGNFLKMVYARDPDTLEAYPVGWWRIDDDSRATFREEPWIVDVRRDFAPGGVYGRLANREKLAAKFRDSGVLWILSIPVISERGIRGFVALDSRREEGFGPSDAETCAQLPLSEAVKMALHRRRENRLTACVGLVRELGAQCIDLKQVGQLIVDGLATHFQWDHVAIYEHRPDHRSLELLCQGGELLPEHRRAMPETSGLVGRALAERRDILLANVKDTSVPDAAAYFEGIPGMVSSLALRIPGEPTRWILNAESRLECAFIDEEVGMLHLLLAEVGQVLAHMSLMETRAATLNALKDAVIETDREGVIRQVNPAGCDLLDVDTAAELVGRRLEEFVAEPEVAAALLGTRGFPRRDVMLKSATGHAFPALLSGARLPHEVGGLVFVASDLTHQVEVERTNELKEVFRHASLECRVPLAIASAWLDEIAREHRELAPAIECILQQVRKADMPLERLLRLADPHAGALPSSVPLDFSQVVRDVLAQFPTEEREDVRLDLPPGEVPVRGARDDLRFCVETSLSFAFRTKPQNKPVEVRMQVRDGSARLSVGGDWTPSLGADPGPAIRQRWRRTAASDLALADDVIEGIVRRAAGNFESALDSRLLLAIELPLARGG